MTMVAPELMVKEPIPVMYKAAFGSMVNVPVIVILEFTVMDESGFMVKLKKVLSSVRVTGSSIGICKS